MMVLPVCTCGENKVPEEHTLDIHDYITGQCRSFANGISCSCTHFVDSGKRVNVYAS